MRIACVQTQARDVNQAELSLREALEGIDRAAAGNPDLVLLPECIYPGYMLCDLMKREGVQHVKERIDGAVGLLAEKARQHGIYLAAGIVTVEDGVPYNSALLLDDRGRVKGKAHKRFLWHFDSSWFEQGHDFDVIETPWGRTGLLICADARLPETARILRLMGAELILDLTNLTSSGRNPAALSNPQVDYMLRARALENSLWVAVANKVGVEQDSVVYCGSSCVIAPGGEVVAKASSDQPEVLFAEMDLSRKPSTAEEWGLDPVTDRKPDVYMPLVAPTENLPATSSVKEKVIPERTNVLVSTVQLDWSSSDTDSLVTRTGHFISKLNSQGAGLIVFSEPSVPDGLTPGDFGRILEEVKARSSRFTGPYILLTGPEECPGNMYKTCFVIRGGKTVGKYRKVHLEEKERATFTPGDGGLPVFAADFGRFGIMLGAEGLLPEVARVLSLQGADLVAWPVSSASADLEMVARTRASESRIFLAVANNTGSARGESMIVNPGGAIVAQAFSGREQGIAAPCCLASARVKSVVPGTDVVADRCPADYAILATCDTE